MVRRGELQKVELDWRTKITNCGSLCETQGDVGAHEQGRLMPSWYAIARRRSKAGDALMREVGLLAQRERLLEAALQGLVDRIDRLDANYDGDLEPELEAARALLEEGEQ